MAVPLLGRPEFVINQVTTLNIEHQQDTADLSIWYSLPTRPGIEFPVLRSRITLQDSRSTHYLFRNRNNESQYELFVAPEGAVMVDARVPNRRDARRVIFTFDPANHTLRNDSLRIRGHLEHDMFSTYSTHITYGNRTLHATGPVRFPFGFGRDRMVREVMTWYHNVEAGTDLALIALLTIALEEMDRIHRIENPGRRMRTQYFNLGE